MANTAKVEMGHGDLYPYPETAGEAAKLLLAKVRGEEVPLACAVHAGWHLQGFAQSRLLPDNGNNGDNPPMQGGSPRKLSGSQESKAQHGTHHASHEAAEDEPQDTKSTNPPANVKPAGQDAPRKAVGFKHVQDPSTCNREQCEHVLAQFAGERGVGAEAGGIFTDELLSKLLSVTTKLLLDWMSKRAT